MNRNRFLVLATLILLIAAVLRLAGLATYPPGPHYDEAANLLIARSVAFGGARFFPMVEAYQGREVLYYYLSVPILTFVSDSMFGLRLLSAFCNLITIAASVALGRAMFHGVRGLIVGLAVGVLMTLSFPQLWLARQAYRAVTLPMMQSLALLFLFKGLAISARSASRKPSFTPSPRSGEGAGGEVAVRAGSREPSALRSSGRSDGDVVTSAKARLKAYRLHADQAPPPETVAQPSPSPRERGLGGEVLLLIAGILAGLTVYTYNASRLFPLWLLIGGIALFWFDRAHWRQRLGQGVNFFGALAITAAPMLIYAFQRPDVFFGRLAEVTQADQSVTLAQSILLHLKMFFIAGDPYFRYNVAGRPYFTLPEGLLLLIGITLAAYRLIRSRRPRERTAYLLALLAPLMVIPSLISVGGLPPSHMRSLGMVPLIFVLVALGAEWVIQFIDGWVGAHRRAPLQTALEIPSPRERGFRGEVAFLAFLLIGAVLVGNLYFTWASSAALYFETDADLAAVANWLVDPPVDPGEQVYVAARDKGHPTVMIAPVPPITWIGTDSLFLPPPGETGLAIFPHSAPPPPDWAVWLAQTALSGQPHAPDGEPAFQAFRLTSDLPLPLAVTTLNVRNQYLTYAGMNVPIVAAGAASEVVMAWRIDTPPAFSDLTPVLQLEDARGNVLYHGDVYMAGTDEWRAGATLLQRIDVSVPPATPPGDYVVRLAWVERSTDTYQPYFNDQGVLGAAWATLGTLRVTRPAAFPDPSALPLDVRRNVQLAPGVILLGWDLPPASIRPGEALPLTLYWQAGALPQPLELRALLVGANAAASAASALWSGTPVDNRYPPDQWQPGEVLADRVNWRIPRDQAPGTYTIMLAAGERRIELADIDIAGIARQFEPPPVDHVINAHFGDHLLLYGYSVGQSEGKINLELIWKAQDNIATDYKVFVHLVDSAGSILAQRDAMPRMNTYPTSLWSAGEFVDDTYEFLDAGASDSVVLHVGLYSPDDGTRLPILDNQRRIIGDYVVISG